MIFCTNKMEYPLRTQYQRVQKQVGYKVSWISTEKGEGGKLVLGQLKLIAANSVAFIHLPKGSFISKKTSPFLAALEFTLNAF